MTSCDPIINLSPVSRNGGGKWGERRGIWKVKEYRFVTLENDFYGPDIIPVYDIYSMK